MNNTIPALAILLYSNTFCFAQKNIQLESELTSVSLTRTVKLSNLPDDVFLFNLNSPEADEYEEGLGKGQPFIISTKTAAANATNKTSLNPLNIKTETSFQGTDGSSPPPDDGMSVSNHNYIVHAVNTRIMVFDTLGNILMPFKNLVTFFNRSSSYASDPRVIYDFYNDRFIVLMMTSNTSARIDIAFSQTNDPTGTWNIYSTICDVVPNNYTMFDYPHAMITEHELIITGTKYGPSVSSSQGVVQIRKQDGYSGKTNLAIRKWNGITNPLGQPATTLTTVTAGQQGSTYGTRAYFVSSSQSGGNAIILYELSDTLNGNPTFSSTFIGTTTYRAPQYYVGQLNGTYPLLPIDSRGQHAFFLNGKIHFVYHAMDQTGNTIGIRYNRIDVATKTMTTAYHKSNSSNYYCPSVASFAMNDSDGSVVIGYLECNPSMNASIRAIACDNNMNFGNPIQVKNGSAAINKIAGASYGRWGDYTSGVRQHNAGKPTVWISGQYGETFGLGNYRTWIAKIVPDVSTTEIAATPPKNNKSISVYPNPVISFFSFTINLEKEEENVLVTIYDIEGRKIQELFNGEIPQGTSQMEFNKNALSAGVYYLTVSSETETLYREKIVIQ